MENQKKKIKEIIWESDFIKVVGYYILPPWFLPTSHRKDILRRKLFLLNWILQHYILHFQIRIWNNIANNKKSMRGVSFPPNSHSNCLICLSLLLSYRSFGWLFCSAFKFFSFFYPAMIEPLRMILSSCVLLSLIFSPLIFPAVLFDTIAASE